MCLGTTSRWRYWWTTANISHRHSLRLLWHCSGKPENRLQSVENLLFKWLNICTGGQDLRSQISFVNCFNILSLKRHSLFLCVFLSWYKSGIPVCIWYVLFFSNKNSNTNSKDQLIFIQRAWPQELTVMAVVLWHF